MIKTNRNKTTLKNSFSGQKSSGKKKKSLVKFSSVSSKSRLFPIVVIGASAGGLEAYTRILKNLSPDTGMAFVIIQHLSPDYKSMLPEILRRETAMEVITIENGMKPQSNKVYVSPPNNSVNIKEGIFYLKRREDTRKAFMPIDIFMRSLVEDHMHFAIGVILSGSDSDGAIGMEFIKTHGGITYAQDRKSSKFFDMPSNSINAGVVDFVLSPEAIAREIKRISNNVYVNIKNYSNTEEVLSGDDESVYKILAVLHKNKNIDFNLYKPTTLKRRILRRMLMHKKSDAKEYLNFLTGNQDEINFLCQDILINVTSFFRDPSMFESLKKNVFPKLFKNRAFDNPVRLWVTACSTGEETYSIAIALIEFLGPKISKYQIQIFSTDLSEAGIEKARTGVYPSDIKVDVSEERLKKYFVKTTGKYRINKNIRELCVFAKQNLIQDPPFSKMDIVSCRNVLIYLGLVLQNKIFPIFHYALKDNGFLVLGTSETVGTYKNLFELIDKKNMIYFKTPFSSDYGYEYNIREMIPTKINFRDTDINVPLLITSNTDDLEKESDTLILKKYTPSGAVVDKNMEIILFKGNTEPYLEIPQGIPSNNILKMARKGLAEEIKFLITSSDKKNEITKKYNISFNHLNKVRRVNIIVEPFLYNSSKRKLFLILFEEGEDKYKALEVEDLPSNNLRKNKIGREKQELGIVSDELAVNKVHLQSVIEQIESTNEELRSANEEIQSSNEELQSTNEELETTKEELQSTNEELTTVNEELQNSNIEMSNINDDMNNLLSSIKISIVMVDSNLRIKRFTNEASKLLNIIQTDIGRKITDLNPNVEITDLRNIINEVIETTQIKELEVKDNEDCWYSMRVRPYKTLDKRIEGAMIAFVDITEMKKNLQQKISIKESEKLNRELEKRVDERTFQLITMNESLQSEISERRNVESSLRILSKNLVDAQEKERLRLSRELHDSVNQILFLAKLKLHTAEEKLKNIVKNKSNLKSITEIKNYIEKAIEEVRRLSHDLRPSALDDIGVVAALRSIIDDFKKRTHIDVRIKVGKMQKRFSKEIELVLYRVVQEGLHNIEKHSRAKNVHVDLRQNKNHLRLSLTDNGRGFDQSINPNKKKGIPKLGLIGLNERTNSVGGKLNIKSENGLGTMIEVIIPSKIKDHEKPKQTNKNTAGRRPSTG